MYNIIGEYMSIIELGNGKVLKDGVVFDEDARKYCTKILTDKEGKVIGQEYTPVSYTHLTLPTIYSV